MAEGPQRRARSVSTPGTVQFSVVRNLPVAGHEMCALVVDLERYVQIEPRLDSAEWTGLSRPPQIGAIATVTANLPAHLPLLRRFLGQPSGVARLEAISQDRVAYSLDTGLVIGHMEATFSDTPGGCIADVTGWVRPKGRAAQAAMHPVRHSLGRMLSGFVARGLARASEGARLPPNRA